MKVVVELKIFKSGRVRDVHASTVNPGCVVTRCTVIEISGSDLSSNLMEVDTFFLTLLLFAINKAYF